MNTTHPPIFRVTLTDLTQNFHIVVGTTASKKELVEFVLQWYFGFVVKTDYEKGEDIDPESWHSICAEMYLDLMKNDEYQCDLYEPFDAALKITFEFNLTPTQEED